MREAYPTKTSTAAPNPTHWMKLVELIQFMWENENVPTELGWNVLVIISKGNTDTRGICMLGVMWKVVEAVVDTCTKTVV